ncbi:hypothetical protein diail_3564 [Diaporthe ilicicola]|nr:hypothetical protein diail_3564 [Diaporthe ilicicola]
MNTCGSLVRDNSKQNTGRCAPRQLLQDLMRFCPKHSLHLISDEIYGLSCWGNAAISDTPAFHSVISLDTTDLIDPGLVHALWGMSKVCC